MQATPLFSSFEMLKTTHIMKKSHKNVPIYTHLTSLPNIISMSFKRCPSFRNVVSLGTEMYTSKTSVWFLCRHASTLIRCPKEQGWAQSRKCYVTGPLVNSQFGCFKETLPAASVALAKLPQSAGRGCLQHVQGEIAQTQVAEAETASTTFL